MAVLHKTEDPNSKKRSVSVLLVLICAAVLFYGFTIHPAVSKTDQGSIDLSQHTLKDGERFLSFPWGFEMGIYDSSENKWLDIMDEECAICFGFGNEYPYFSVGNYGNTNFRVAKIEDGIIKYIYREDDNRSGLVPLCTDGTLFVYEKEYHIDDVRYSDFLSINDDGSYKEIMSLKNAYVQSGALIGNILYLSDYNRDRNLFTVAAYDLSAAQPEKTKKIILDDYEYGDIFVYRNALAFYDSAEKLLYGDSLHCRLPQNPGELTIDERIDCVVLQTLNQDYDIEISFIDPSTGNVLAAYAGAINYDVKDHTVTVYTNGNTEVFHPNDKR